MPIAIKKPIVPEKGTYSTSKVASVVELAEATNFDITVDEAHEFYANGISVKNCLGKFHPHGDQSVFGALVNMTNSNTVVPLFDGEGNWGSLSDQAFAAMRYVEARLSKFSDEILFNKFYLPVMESSPNYDSQDTEPVVLPALLPVLFLNGRFGIAPGAQTNIPAFSFTSMLKLLKVVYTGTPLSHKLMYKTLRIVSVYGGVERKPPDVETRKLRMSLFKNRVGKTVLWSNPAWDLKTKTVKVTRFAPEKMERMLISLGKLAGVAEVRDASSTGEQYGTITVVPKRGTSDADAKKLVQAVDSALATTENYILNFTERYLDETGQAQARLCSMSILQAMIQWVDWRKELERKACAYWIAEAAKHIRHQELLILAVDNRKLILESLEKDLDQPELEVWLAKKLGITPAEAHVIYELRVIQLRKLERVALLEKKRAIEAHKAELERRKKKPEPFMLDQLTQFAKLG